MNNERDCQHGRHERSCYICDLEEEIVELTERHARELRAVAEAVRNATIVGWRSEGEWLEENELDAIIASVTGKAAQPAVDHTPPFGNCQFKLCDLPGQCRSEGACHHPKLLAPSDGQIYAAVSQRANPEAQEQAMQALVGASHKIERAAGASSPAERGHVPCPFCGGEVDPRGWLSNAGVRGPECVSCGATAPSMLVWNRRATLNQPSGERRAAFEAAFEAREGYKPCWDGMGEYSFRMEQVAWEMWQAAIASQGREPVAFSLQWPDDVIGNKINPNAVFPTKQLAAEYAKDCLSPKPIIAPLYTCPQPTAQGVPDGWQLVPKEPTEEMRQAGLRHTGAVHATWRDMLAAAPDGEGKNG